MRRRRCIRLVARRHHLAGRLLPGNRRAHHRYPLRKTERVPPSPHRDITLTERFMDAMGTDVRCCSPRRC